MPNHKTQKMSIHGPGLHGPRQLITSVTSLTSVENKAFSITSHFIPCVFVMDEETLFSRITENSFLIHMPLPL